MIYELLNISVLCQNFDIYVHINKYNLQLSFII